MPIVTLSQEKIIQCYVSLFGRAPERAGLDYWVSQIEGGRTWQQVAQDMYNVQPAREMYPDWLSNEGVIQRFYTGVFGREPDAEGLKYWSKQLEAKTRGEVICDLITAAVNYGGTDPAGLLSKSLFSNKVDIGVAFALEHNGSDIAFSKTLLKYVKAGSEGKAVPTQLMTQHFDSSASTPVIRLKIDSGASSDDLITNTAEIEVTGAEAGALISYSQDGGSVWSDRIDASADGLKNLVVRVYEPNNQKTSLVLFSFTLDTTVVAISDVALKNDTGASNNDKVTRIGELDVKTSSESSVLYSTDSGKNWGTSYVPREGHNLVFVRAIDIAGNYSEVRTIEFDLDTLIVTPTLRLKVDSGNTSTDSLTNESEVVVVGTETNADLAYSWDAGATWSSNYDAGTDGEKTLLVRTTDKAGNQAGSAAFKFILDVTAPAKPIVSLLSDSGASDHDHISTSPTLALTTESGASIAYSFDGGINWNEVYNPGGDGTKGVLVRSTDKAGNVSQSVPFNFTLDTSTTAPIVILANDTGNSNTDRISKDGNLTISNIEAGATLSYSLDGTTFTNEFVAAQGENTVIVRANDVAGNSAQTLLSFKLDTVAPMVPSVNLFADSGMSVIDKITKTALLNVVAEVDSTTSYSFDGGVSWSETYAPGADGTKIVFVRSTDKAGNVSQSSAFSFTLDTSTTIPSVALASDTGASNDDRISRETTLSIANVEAGASLTYSIDGGTLFTTSFTAVQGENAVIVRATDTAGNTAQTLFNFKLDTVAPYAPSVSLLTDSGLSASDKLTKVATLNVTAEVATTTTYSLDGGANWSENYVLGADGDKTVLVRSTDKAGNISQSAVFNFTLDTSVATPGVGLLNDTGRFDSDRLSNDGVLSIVNLEAGANLFFSMDGGVNWSERYAPGADGIKTVLVRATDKAGNISQSSALNFTLDTTTTAPNVVLKNDTGNSNSDRISRDSSLSINNVEADATLSYSTDGGNSFTANFVAAQGENAVIVRATDLAGNTAQTLLNFKFDTVLPATPIVNLLTDSGVSSSDKLTKSAALNLTTEEGTTTNYSFDGGASWLEAYAPGIDGVKSVLVRSIDKAGNISQSAAFNFTLDSSTNAPRVVLASDTGSSNNDRISKDGGLLISNVETGATLSYSMDGNTFTNSFIAVQGENAVIVRATDAAGNTAQTLLNFKLDSVAPIAPTVTLSIDSGTSGSDKLTKSAALNITKEDGAFLTYSFDGGVSWSEVYAAGADGMKTVLVRSTDAAGNTSQNTAYSFTLDTSISAPVVALANDTGSLNSDSISKDGSLAISNVEAGSIVSYSVDGGNLFTSAFVAVQGENAGHRQSNGCGRKHRTEVVQFYVRHSCAYCT
ncbi:DUF4214 domain-containing protein [Undibacterium sp. Ji22W]|uniref:DUF4214 domain-containing protein n=1 Tax=Undibacterium sp. Ji22W TaxID=3413038 RepID=UPI003BEF5541